MNQYFHNLYKFTLLKVEEYYISAIVVDFHENEQKNMSVGKK